MTHFKKLGQSNGFWATLHSPLLDGFDRLLSSAAVNKSLLHQEKFFEMPRIEPGAVGR